MYYCRLCGQDWTPPFGWVSPLLIEFWVKPGEEQKRLPLVSLVYWYIKHWYKTLLEKSGTVVYTEKMTRKTPSRRTLQSFCCCCSCWKKTRAQREGSVHHLFVH